MAKKTKPLTGKFGDFSGIVLKAAARGNIPAVKKYLKENPAWLNQVGPHGRTLLWEASYTGRTAMISELIARGADVNAIGSYYTPMLVELSAVATARAYGHGDAVSLLEAAGAHDDFYAACHRGDLETMASFIKEQHGIVNQPLREDHSSPRMGCHPIHYATVGGHIQAIELLIREKAKVGEHLELLLDWALGDQKIIRMLKKHGEPKRSSYKTQKKPMPKVPPVDRPDWLGFPELVDECRGNHNATDDPDRVQEVLDRGANINVTDHKGKTALHRASQAGFLNVTQLLIDNGADLEIADHKGATPLFDASFYGRADTVRILVKNGADIEHADRRGDTALFAAARGKRDHVFELLLKMKANTGHENNRGDTVQDVLSKARHQTEERRRMLRLLKSKRRKN